MKQTSAQGTEQHCYWTALFSTITEQHSAPLPHPTQVEEDQASCLRPFLAFFTLSQ